MVAKFRIAEVNLVELNNDDINMIRVHPDNSDIVYISSASDKKLYKLTNSGTTIAPIGTGLPTTEYIRIEIVGNYDGNYANDTMYVAAGSQGIYKSTNSGGGFSASNGLSPNNLPIGQAEFRNLAVSPVDGQRLYAAMFEHTTYYYSSDGGRNWHSATSYDEKNIISSLEQQSSKISGEYYSKPFAPHPKLAAWVFSSVSKSIIAKSTDGGANWKYSNTGRNQINVGWAIDKTDMNSIDFDPADPKKFSVHAMDNGTFVTEDGGFTFRSVNIPNRQDTDGNNNIYSGGVNANSGARRGNVMVTTNGGWDNRQIIISRNIDQLAPTWTALTETAKSYSYHNIRFHPQNNNIVYAENYRFDNIQSANSYTTLSRPVRVVYPNNGDTVYTIYGVDSTTARIERSDDRGTTWTRNTYANPSVQYADIPIKSAGYEKMGKVAVKPGNRDVLYVPSSGYGLNIINGNQRALKTADIPTNFDYAYVAVDPKNTNNVYFGVMRKTGGGTGIYKSSDGGNSFVSINGNLGKYFSVFYLNINSIDSYVWMALSGGGIWKLPIDGDTTAPTAPTGLKVVQ